MGDTHDRLVFVRVGWMRFYDGLRREPDGPIGGGSFNAEEPGSEVENFTARRGWYLGYATLPGGADSYNLERVAGAPVGGSQLTNVLVVSVAKRPGGGQVVVGWHGQATLLSGYPNRPRSGYGVYNFRAPVGPSVLLPVHARSWEVPKGASGMGQANVYYVDGRRRRHYWVQRVLRGIASYRRDRRGGTELPEVEEGLRRRTEADRLARSPKLIAACLERDRFRCRHCKLEPRAHLTRIALKSTPILQVHHIRPLSHGKRRTRIADLLTLCPTCHAMAHALSRATGSAEVDLHLLREFYRPHAGSR